MEAIAYGIMSSPQQEGKEIYRRQNQAKKANWNFDVASEDKKIENRTAFQRQPDKCTLFGVRLHIEHSDRLVKSYDHKTIKKYWDEISQRGVKFRYAHSNRNYRNRISEILSSKNSIAKKQTRLICLIDQYLKHRNVTVISNNGFSNAPPPLEPYPRLITTPYFPALTECADHLLKLKPQKSYSKYGRYIDAYLGAAFNRKIFLKKQRGKKYVPRSQRTYGEHSDDFALFATIRELETRPHFTRCNRPKRVSDAIIAYQLNSLGYRNLRGRLLSRKSVWAIRRCPAYCRYTKSVSSTKQSFVDC